MSTKQMTPRTITLGGLYVEVETVNHHTHETACDLCGCPIYVGDTIYYCDMYAYCSRYCFKADQIDA